MMRVKICTSIRLDFELEMGSWTAHGRGGAGPAAWCSLITTFPLMFSPKPFPGLFSLPLSLQVT